MTKEQAKELISQIGMMNLFAISGGRVHLTAEGSVQLKVGSGYSVIVELAGNDTYTVSRVYSKGLKTWVKGVQTNVYCDEVGEVAYQASCFVNVKFGEGVVA
jgi:hypothetical protein